MNRRPRRRWLLLLLGSISAAGVVRAAGDPAAAGAYCPLPPPGERPRCLDPAQATYGEFFEALERGVPTDAATARLDADLAAGPGSENAYLALSSVAYGYWRLSERAAAAQTDPALAARLESWNALLREAYAAAPADPSYRSAVREAALDLRRRAPPVRLRCVDAAGGTGEVGLRGALERLLLRIFGGEDS